MANVEEQLIKDYTPLIVSIARKYRFLAEYDDLFSEGVIALLIAYRKYDDSAGIPLAGYLKQQVTFAVQIKAREIYTPVYIPHKTNAILHAIKRRGLGSEPVEDICKALNQSESEVRRALIAYKHSNMESIDSEVMEDKTLADLFAITQDYSVVMVNDFVSKLNDRQKAILRLLYSGTSQTQIGKELGISQSQVGREIEKLRKLYRREQIGH